MTEFKLTRLPNGQISCEMEGTETEVAKMICEAMVGSLEVASMISAAIPSFLDKQGIDRAAYCKTVIAAQGGK